MIATLFDFNGVLIDDEAVHLAAFRDVLRPLGITIDDAAYEERYLGFDDAGAFRAILRDAGRAPSDEDVARLVEAKKPVYMARIAAELRVFEGAPGLVRRRARLGPVGIVSGALRHEIEHALGVMGVREHVAFIVAAEDTTECKPDPEGYLLGARALEARGHLDRGGIVVVEDSTAGVLAAKRAGLFCAAVAHSYPADRLRAAGADAVAGRLLDLTDAVLDDRRA
ncbi:MAG: HAD family phosphatase [Polyangiaceae bacterium]|nr:HAD family phosphatase [Polyangiaceae bacterium]